MNQGALITPAETDCASKARAWNRFCRHVAHVEKLVRSPFLKVHFVRYFQSAIQDRYSQISRATGGPMRSVLVNAALLVCAVPAIAQNPSTGTPIQNPANVHANQQMARQHGQALEPPPSLAEVPADTPVVTLEGVCDSASTAGSKSCKTVITRAEMERIVSMLAAGAPQASREQIAINYVRMLAASQVAEKHKLEDDPAVASEVQEQMKLARMQVLTKAMNRHMEAEAENPPMPGIQQYYSENQTLFEQGEVWRLSLPKSTRIPNSEPINPATLKAEAESLRSRVVTGYDFEQLEQLAYKDLGIMGVPPPTKMTMVRRRDLPSDQAIVFDLQPGDVSQVIDSYADLVILKLVSKQTAPLDSVLPEIKSELKGARLQQEIQEASKSIAGEFNLKYFGLAAPPALFVLPGNSQSFARAARTPDARNRALQRRRMPMNPKVETVTPQSHP